MGLFTMPDGSTDDGSSDDSSSFDSTSGDGALSSLFGLDGVGAGYGVTTYTDPPTPTQAASTLGDLQSGSTSTAFDWNSAFADTLGTIVALDSINNQPNTTGVGYYTAANGQTYPIGTGPGATATGSVSGNLLFWLLVLGGAFLFIEHEERK